MTSLERRSERVEVSKVAVGLWRNLLHCGSQVAPVWEVEKEPGIRELINKGLVRIVMEGELQRMIELSDQSLSLGEEHKKALSILEKSNEPVVVSSVILSLKTKKVNDPLTVIKRLIDLSLVEFDKTSLSLKTCY